MNYYFNMSRVDFQPRKGLTRAGIAPSQAESIEEQVIGTWKLRSWVVNAGGTQRPGVLGPNTIGQFMFARDGHFCVGFMQPDRSKFQSPDYWGGTTEERVQAWNTYSGFCGTFELNAEGGFVLLKPTISAYPNWTGSLQKRFLTISGDQMTLRTPAILIGGEETFGELVWDRVR